MELLEVMRRIQGRRRTEAVGDTINEGGVWAVEIEGYSGVVDLLDHDSLASGLPQRIDRGGELGIHKHIVVPEHDVVGGKRFAVGPAHALAQPEREGLGVLADLEGLRDMGDDI